MKIVDRIKKYKRKRCSVKLKNFRIKGLPTCKGRIIEDNNNENNRKI